ncbi:hypothetical protein [Paraburkholderia sp. BL10I2N1]|uniref:hypothetical protein n=1 Tax=Paraburkholderia sp. BL10I2N1 TaxID=1938796 RepID=UPI00105E3B2A|nr:hypothetical protein [Paraburkholderia sp. BL10I2N1]TDN69215.1 hypothetical protein B0G77_2591 [Paraburkholderia sp. BL10I2N1]
MELWIQPCDACADLHGQRATVDPHDDLALKGAGVLKGDVVELHYICKRCGAAFTRILAGPPGQQTWMLLNAGQH